MTEDAHIVKWLMIGVAAIAFAIAIGVGMSALANSNAATACIEQHGTLKGSSCEYKK